MLMVLVILAGLLLLSRVSLTVQMRIQNLSYWKVDIQVKAFGGLIRIKRSWDIKEYLSHVFDDEEESGSWIHKWIHKRDDLQEDRMFSYLKGPVLNSAKELTIHFLNWHSGAGTGDAAVTGRLAGIVWAVKGAMEAWLKQHISMRKTPDLKFVPSFQARQFTSELSCMVSIRTGKAIVVIHDLYKQWKTFRRRDDSGTSNQRVNDNSDGKFEGNDRREYDRWRSG
ncbi:DUF2953 domain-containing protein [Siminovitchia sediminis]|uniref:DUF2953 domain-containing protein n=1 Tax=Siminovitchia sediminis TaxID=1274353 RepID=A0ABW4KMK4_9BACI